MLEVKNLTVHYDGAMALNDVSINVKKGELVSVVGPNGAGKTTLLKAISGTLKSCKE
jgi:ABC-type cobalamin/Fe3+-siderophores transport system ATPase subunit